MPHTRFKLPITFAEAPGSEFRHSPLRLLIVDPQRVVAEALADRFRCDRRIEVVGVATTPQDMLSHLRRPQPHVVLIDICCDAATVLDQCAEIRERSPEVRLIFLTANESDFAIKVALECSAGFLLKSEALDDVVEAVCGSRGKQPFSQRIEKRVRLDAAKSRYVLRDHSPASELTARQIEVLRHVAHGRTSREIAARLQLTPRGVESHTHRIMHKLEIYDRVSLTRYAIREGLLAP